jgi:acylphosphatase
VAVTDERVRARAVVRGRVQGVWFRQSTADEMRAIGAAGWVRNRADGAVEAVFEGSPAVVERALAYVRIGPPRAAVTSVDVEWEEPIGETGFAVRG